MRVLEKGREQEGPSKIFYCNVRGGCGAKLLVSYSDLRESQGEDETLYVFHCGHCGTINHVYPWEFP